MNNEDLPKTSRHFMTLGLMLPPASKNWQLIFLYLTAGGVILSYFYGQSSNTKFYSYFETSGDQSSNLYLNVVNFFNTSVN
jgi:hypothetical protein